MKRSRSMAWTLAGATAALAVGGAAWSVYSNAARAEELEREVAALQARRDDVEAARRELERRSAVVSSSLATARALLAHAEAEERSLKETKLGSPVPAAKPRERYDEDLAQILETTRNHPAVQQAENESYRAQLRVYYADLARKLGWSEERFERFTTNLLEHSVRHRELLEAARSLGVSDYDPAVIALYEKDVAAYRETQRTLIGEEGLREMLRYDETMGARHLASSFAGMATLADVPLAGPQVQALAEIIARETRPAAVGPFPLHVETNWERVDAAAKAILSERQLALFQQMESPRGASRFMKQLNHAIMSANYADAVGGK